MPKHRRDRRIPLDTQFTLWLEFEVLTGVNPDDDFCNIAITPSNGEVYALNVWTYKLLERLNLSNRRTGDNLGGKYLEPPDLFIERLDRQLFTEVVADLIRRDRLRAEWRVEPSDDPLDDADC